MTVVELAALRDHLADARARGIKGSLRREVQAFERGLAMAKLRAARPAPGDAVFCSCCPSPAEQTS